MKPLDKLTAGEINELCVALFGDLEGRFVVIETLEFHIYVEVSGNAFRILPDYSFLMEVIKSGLEGFRIDPLAYAEKVQEIAERFAYSIALSPGDYAEYIKRFEISDTMMQAIFKEEE